jgi:hypothetical protein
VVFGAEKGVDVVISPALVFWVTTLDRFGHYDGGI